MEYMRSLLLLTALLPLETHAANSFKSAVPEANSAFRVKFTIESPAMALKKQPGPNGTLAFSVEVMSAEIGNRQHISFRTQVKDPQFPFSVELAEKNFRSQTGSLVGHKGNVRFVIQAEYCEGECPSKSEVRYLSTTVQLLAFSKTMALDFAIPFVASRFSDTMKCPQGDILAAGKIKASRNARKLEGNKGLVLVANRVLPATFGNTNVEPYHMIPIAVSPVEFRGGEASFSIARQKAWFPGYNNAGIRLGLVDCSQYPNDLVECSWNRVLAATIDNISLIPVNRQSPACGDSAMQLEAF